MENVSYGGHFHPACFTFSCHCLGMLYSVSRHYDIPIGISDMYCMISALIRSGNVSYSINTYHITGTN